MTLKFKFKSSWLLECSTKKTNLQNKQVHSLCVDSRPGDRSLFAKGPHHHLRRNFFFTQQNIFNTCKNMLHFLKIWLSLRYWT